MDWPIIIFHMDKVIRGADFGSGFLSRILELGGSVARARAANVSMIRLTQSNWTGVRIGSSFGLAIPVTNVMPTAVMLTVSWNYNKRTWVENIKPWIMENLPAKISW
jgi:hypothetical protein